MQTILRFLLLINFISLAIFACRPIHQSNYYFSTSGSDSNPGTLERPFRTFEALKKISLQPGDSVLFRGGDTYQGTLEIYPEGTKQKPVVITSFNGGRAIIQSGDSIAVNIAGNWFELRNIEASGSGRKTGNVSHGISVFDSRHAVIENISVDGFQKCGLSVYNSDSLLIRNIFATENGSIGIYVFESRNCEVKDCVAENNPGDPTNLDNHSGNGILVGESKNINVNHCVATNNGWDMPRQGNGPVGIWAYQSDSIIIEYCIAYRNRTAPGAKDGGGFDFDGGMTNSVIRYCLSYENEGAGYGLFQYEGAHNWKNNTICYNVSINDGISTDGAGGIFVWNGGPTTEELSDCHIFNNLVYNEKKPAVVFEAASKHLNFVFSNNIFLGKGDLVSGPSSGDRYRGNCWWGIDGSSISFRGYKSLDDWAGETGQDSNDTELACWKLDPQLNGPFLTDLTDPYELNSLEGLKILKNSPVRDKGLQFNKIADNYIPTHDFYGNPVSQGQAPEPGIFEINEEN